MPWWGNASFAQAISQALGNQLGFPNTSSGKPVAPWVGFDLLGPAGSPFLVARYSQEDILGQLFLVQGDPAQFSTSTTWVQIAPTAPAPVPGPLPLFGAAAAFGMSRRLRRRIKLSA